MISPSTWRWDIEGKGIECRSTFGMWNVGANRHSGGQNESVHGCEETGCKSHSRCSVWIEFQFHRNPIMITRVPRRFSGDVITYGTKQKLLCYERINLNRTKFDWLFCEARFLIQEIASNILFDRWHFAFENLRFFYINLRREMYIMKWKWERDSSLPSCDLLLLTLAVTVTCSMYLGTWSGLIHANMLSNQSSCL